MEIQKKKCSKCEQEKELDKFNKCEYKAFGVQSACKECCKKYAKKYRENNIDDIKEKRKEQYWNDKPEIMKHYVENHDDIIADKKQYYKDNTDKIKKRVYTYRKNRLATDPLFRLSYTIGTLIRNAFKRKFTTKSKRTLEILGCTYEEFYKHLESKFDDKMNWQNQGSYWVIDHIKPISLAMTEQEVYELNHYTNLQPLSAVENSSKGNKY
jgi:hypothetical protein